MSPFSCYSFAFSCLVLAADRGSEHRILDRAGILLRLLLHPSSYGKINSGGSWAAIKSVPQGLHITLRVTLVLIVVGVTVYPGRVGFAIAAPLSSSPLIVCLVCYVCR